MVSPLLSYANAYLTATGGVTISRMSGRITTSGGQRYLVHAFMKRQQAPTTETGSKKVPKAQNDGTILPGAGGEYYIHRGYALRYAIINSGFILGVTDPSNLAFINFTQQPEWLLTGGNGEYKMGNDPVMYYTIDGSSGTYGGIGIDRLIYDEIGGIPLVLSVGETQN
jgi:hypothetical protein